MTRQRRAARFEGLAPASERATKSARGASAKRDTKPEMSLRSAIRAVGLKGYRVDVRDLAGRPDVVFPGAKVAVFCDGDFWHGKDLEVRLAKLERGHNAPYWVEKISGNVARDRRHNAELAEAGWYVLRFWESQVHREAPVIAEQVKQIVEQRKQVKQKRSK